jgi:hypothetical protein
MESATTEPRGTTKDFGDYTKNIGDYLETYYKLSVIKATDKATGIASGTLTVAGILVFGFFIVLFASLGFAIWLGQAIGSNVAGYFIVAGFYLLLLGVLILLRKRIVFPFIRNLIIRKIYE